MKFLIMRFLLLFLLIMPSFLFAQKKSSSNIIDKINSEADKIEQKCIAWRRDIHQNPELGNNEYRTAKLVADHLRSLGIDVKEKVGKTGVVGILKGAKPGPCIALRADMDALPIVERVDLPFASKAKTIFREKEVGVMHACGHDTHVAMLMSVAEILSGMKSEIKGTVKFVFQPSEEGPPDGEEGGAPLMIKEGVMEDPKVDAMVGFHIESDIEVGRIEYKSGAFMASSDWFVIKVKGKGSHGSQPWHGIDPIVVSAQIIQGIQNIVSRQSDLTKAPVVITVGRIESGIRNNIMPEESTMYGTIRTLDSKMRLDVHERLKRVAANIAEANGATAETTIDEKTLVTYNDPELLKKIIPSLEKSTSKENVVERNWVTGSEDFSYYGLKAPSVFLNLGGMPKASDPQKAPAHHTPDFFIDESGMKTGIKAFCNIVFDYLNTEASATPSNQSKKAF
jgi:amidohydrolase